MKRTTQPLYRVDESAIDITTFLTTLGLDPDKVVFDTTRIEFQGGPTALAMVKYDGILIVPFTEIAEALDVARETYTAKHTKPDTEAEAATAHIAANPLDPTQHGGNPA